MDATIHAPKISAQRRRPVGALAGPAFAVLALASLFTAPILPAPDAPVQKITSFFIDQRDGILAGGYLYGFAASAFLIFLGTLAGHLRRSAAADESLWLIAVASGAVATAMAILANGAFMTLASRVSSEAGSGAVLALFTLGNKSFAAIDFASAVFVAAVSLAALRTGALPRWLARSGLVLALAMLSTTVGLAAESGPATPFGPYTNVVFVLFLLWNSTVGISCWRATPTRK